MKLESKWQVLLVVSLGIFMSTLDGSILNIANPTIASELAVELKQVQWVVTGYMLVITSSLLFFGKLGDRIGSEKIFSLGFAIFTLGSLFCGLASSLPTLISARVFQALGASMLMATGVGIVSNTFPAGERGKALGVTGSVVGIGNSSGPALGGFLIAHFNWPVVFWINVPIGILAVSLAFRYLPRQARIDDGNGFDPVGVLFFGLAAIILVLSIATGTSINPVLMALGIGLLLLFYYLEKGNPHAMLDLELFKIKPFLYGNMMGFINYVSQTFMFFLLPFYMERLLQYSPSVSGLLMTIPPACMAVTAPLAGSLSDRIGPSKLTSISFFLVTAAFLLFSSMTAATGMERIIPGLVIMGIGLGSFGSPNNSSILGSVPKTKAGYTGGFIATIRNFGFSLGIAISASLFTWFFTLQQQTLPYNEAYISASRWVYYIAASLALTGLIISFATRESRGKSSASQSNR